MNDVQKIAIVVAVSAPFIMQDRREYLTWGRFDDGSKLLGVWVAYIAVWFFWRTAEDTEK
jgi:hypothetical protein